VWLSVCFCLSQCVSPSQTCSTCPTDCGVCSPLENYPPKVSNINHDAVDVDPTTIGLQVYEGTTVTYSGSASDPDGEILSWQWIYTIHDGQFLNEILFLSGTGPIANAVFTYGPGTAGKTYTWISNIVNAYTLTIGTDIFFII